MARMPNSLHQSTSMSSWRVLWLLLTGGLALQVHPLMGATFVLANNLKAVLSGPDKVKAGVSAEGGATVTYNGRCTTDGECTKAKIKGFVEVRGPNNYYFKGPEETKTLKAGESGKFIRKWRFPKPGQYTVTVQINGSDDDGTKLKYVKSRKVTVTD